MAHHRHLCGNCSMVNFQESCTWKKSREDSYQDLHSESKTNIFKKCQCKPSLDSFLPDINCCTGPIKRCIQSRSLDDVMNEFNFTYRRINQGANLIEYDRNPQSITRTDFTPKIAPSTSNERMKWPVILQEIQKVTTNIPSGKKSNKVMNRDPNMFLHRDCANSSFKKVLQGNELRIPKVKPISVSKADYHPKPFDANIYPFELSDPFDVFEETPCCGKNMHCLLNSFEYRDALVGKKEKWIVDYKKDVNKEDSSFLRAMQAADYNNIDSNPLSVAAKDFAYKKPHFMSDDSWKDFLRKTNIPLKNYVNMVNLYKNLENKRLP